MLPIKFKPIYKETIWGGNRIPEFKGTANPASSQPNIGESWEISGVRDNETVVLEGEYQGWRLNDLVARLQEQLVGRACYQEYGNQFPLLIKFIDARQDLSIQVHPDDETARRQGRERGKTEMWYVMDSAPEAKLYSGLRRHLTPEDYKQLVADDAICDALAQYDVHEGDVFYLPSGRIHAIGAGCFLAEIQQTSDVTWRIYDYNRRDKNGNLRELHTRQAAEAIDYTVYPDYQTHYTSVKNQRQQLVECPFFTTSLCDLTENAIAQGGNVSVQDENAPDGSASDGFLLDYTSLDSFVILIGVKGEGVLTDEQGNETTLRAGESLLIPATATRFRVTGTLRFLETHV